MLLYILIFVYSQLVQFVSSGSVYSSLKQNNDNSLSRPLTSFVLSIQQLSLASSSHITLGHLQRTGLVL